MKHYDAVVLGSGCGMEVVDQAVARGLSIALVEPGLLGGTCPNLGCIPSKMLIASADTVMEQERAERLGVISRIEHVDFASIMIRMRASRAESQEHMEHLLTHFEGVETYRAHAAYIQPQVLQVGDDTIYGTQVFIAVGARPLIPSIEGLEDVEYLTNESVLELTEIPESLIIIGGGYIAVEYCHFFAAMGTRVTLIEMSDRIITTEEPEISATLQSELSKRARIVTGTMVTSVTRAGKDLRIHARSSLSGEKSRFDAQQVLVAVGRRPNADLLRVEKADIRIDENGYIKVDSHMRTNQDNVFAVGDINGKSMFMHSANAQALVSAANAFDHQHVEMDYSAVPHAVYSYPQIASVGLTEAQARNTDRDVISALTPYMRTAKGEALREEVGFTKCIMDRNSEEILGFHIIGPHAPILIQEVVNAMQSGGHLDQIARGIHIHPAMSELIPSSFEDLV